MKTAIWWVRRDLRLTDNQALVASAASAEQVVPVFVLDPALLAAPDVAEQRLAFLLEGLRALDADLRARGSRLVVRRGEPRDELARLLGDCSAHAIFAEEDNWPYAQRRDSGIARDLPLHLVSGLTVHRPDAVLKQDGTPYQVFTAFSRRWRRLPLPGPTLAAPRRLVTPASVVSLPIPAEPTLSRDVPFPPGEREARRRLTEFTNGEDAPIYRYGQERDQPGTEGTSRLSPYLRFGMLSARQAVAAALAAMDAAPDASAQQSAETWLQELVWREFYQAILFHFPQVLEQSFRPELRNVGWRDDEGDFAAWCAGHTGYPLVDAGMRQLAQTGWMHNRVRMLAASFLTKHLLIDWQRGERYFMQHLVDADPAANNGGWQWCAGTGTDAAPYFRIFNPVLQGKRFDPQGRYVRRWVPELADVPSTTVHQPWKMSQQEQRAAGCVIGRDYPSPIVDHRHARERALAAYRAARSDR